MEVKIQVDETQFKDILENELAAFKPEDLHDIITECEKRHRKSLKLRSKRDDFRDNN